MQQGLVYFTHTPPGTNSCQPWANQLHRSRKSLILNPYGMMSQNPNNLFSASLARTSGVHDFTSGAYSLSCNTSHRFSPPTSHQPLPPPSHRRRPLPRPPPMSTLNAAGTRHSASSHSRHIPTFNQQAPFFPGGSCSGSDVANPSRTTVSVAREKRTKNLDDGFTCVTNLNSLVRSASIETPTAPSAVVHPFMTTYVFR